jgi:sulfur-carrier protein
MSDKALTLLYFSWVRERIGAGEERLRVADHIATVGDLLAYLTASSSRHAGALADRDAIRVAVNQTYVDEGFALASGDEVAIFPPVTGG